MLAGTYEAAAGGVELKKVTVLVGAERERQQLEALLIQRAKFTGDADQLRQLNVDEEDLDAAGKRTGTKKGASPASMLGQGDSPPLTTVHHLSLQVLAAR